MIKQRKRKTMYLNRWRNKILWLRRQGDQIEILSLRRWIWKEEIEIEIVHLSNDTVMETKNISGERDLYECVCVRAMRFGANNRKRKAQSPLDSLLVFFCFFMLQLGSCQRKIVLAPIIYISVKPPNIF